MQAIRDFFGSLLIRNRDAARGDCFMRRLVCLDGLRGVLAFYVMLSHTLPFTPMPGWLVWLFSHGGAGVDVFFILSGLVIVQSLASFDYRARPFLIARVMRIYPVFIAVFIAAVAVQPLATGFERMAWIGPDSPARFIWSGGWPNDWGLFIAAHLTMTHGLFPDGVLPDVWVGFLGAAWSLSTEWQFYLLALLIGGRLGLRALAWLFLVVSATAIAWHALVPDAWQFSRAFLPNKAMYFALGAASATLPDDMRVPWRFLAVLGVVLTLCLVRDNPLKALVPLAWGLCLAAQSAQGRSVQRQRAPGQSAQGQRAQGPWMGRGWPGPRTLGALLSSTPLRWFGSISYCLYLVNEPIQKLLGVTLARAADGNAMLFTLLWLPAAVLLPIWVAWWLHYQIETPALRRGRMLAAAA
jgi:peptidoglycan/LPS O-acetylase OafA/YrhL